MQQSQNKRTVRELGVEIWAELSSIDDKHLEWKVKERIVDIVMKVLAKYDGSMIENDKDLPVSQQIPIQQSNTSGKAGGLDM